MLRSVLLAPVSAIARLVSGALMPMLLKPMVVGATARPFRMLPFLSATALSLALSEAIASIRPVVLAVAGENAQASAYEALVVSATGDVE